MNIERYLCHKEKVTVCKYMHILFICINMNIHSIWAISIDINIHVSIWLVLIVPIRKLCLHFAVLFNLNLGELSREASIQVYIEFTKGKKIGNV